MFKEMRALEYALEIIRVMDNSGESTCTSTKISEMLEQSNRIKVSRTYVQKMIQKMVHAGILRSGSSGCTMVRPLDEITVNMVLDICDMPEPDSLLYSLCTGLKEGASLTPVEEFYDFSEAEQES